MRSTLLTRPFVKDSTEAIITRLKLIRDKNYTEKCCEFSQGFSALADWYLDQSESEIDLLKSHQMRLKAVALYQLLWRAWRAKKKDYRATAKCKLIKKQ